MTLDYTVKGVEERIKIADQVIEENWDAIKMYLDNVIITRKVRLTFNSLLHQLANYILYCEEQPTYKEKTQQKFEKTVVHWNLENKDNGDFVYERKFKNILEVTKKDIENCPEINEIQNFIKYLRASQNPNLKGKKLKWIKDLKYNQIAIKESKVDFFKTFKTYGFPSFIETYEIDNISHEFEISDLRTPFNLDLFEQESWKTVLKVLPFKKQVSPNVDKLINVFNKCYGRCRFNPLQNKFIRIYQRGIKNKKSFDFEVVKNQDIANVLGIDRFSTARIIKSICKKLCKTYEELYTDYYYTFIVKGKYKTCSRCGVVKLIQYFYKNRNVCIECYNSTSEENELQIA